MAKFKVGVREKQLTPYACIALFQCTDANTSKETWTYGGIVESDATAKLLGLRVKALLLQ